MVVTFANCVQGLNSALVLLFVVFCFRNVQSQSCNDDTIDIEGYRFDIKPLKSLSKIQFKKGSFEYTFGICNTVVGECGYFDCYRAKNFDGCMYENQFVDYCLGLAATKKFGLVYQSNRVAGFSIYSNGGDQYLDGCWKDKESHRDMEIRVMCEKNRTQITKVELLVPQCSPQVTFTYIFTVYHDSGCIKSCSLFYGGADCEKLKLGMLLGIIIGGAVAAVIILVALCFMCMKVRKRPTTVDGESKKTNISVIDVAYVKVVEEESEEIEMI